MKPMPDSVSPEPSGTTRGPDAWRRWARIFAWAAPILFYVLCMLLPLVGPAAARGSGSPGATQAPHYAKNVAAFFSVWTLTTIAAIAAVVLRRRTSELDWRRDRVVWAECAVLALCFLILIGFLTGALQA